MQQPWDNSIDPTMMGLLGQFQLSDADRTEANSQAMLAFGLSLLGTRKGQQMARLGAAGMNALNARNGSLASASQGKRQSMQDASNALQLQQQMQANRDDQATREVMRGLYGDSQQPTNIDMAGGGPPPAAMPTASSAPATASAGATLPGNPLGKYNQYMKVAEQLYARGAVKSAQEMEKKAKDFLPKLKEQKTLTQNGRRVTVNIYDDGTYQVLPDVSPDQEKAHFLDTGSQIGAVDPFTGKPVAGGGLYNKTMTPGEVASNAVAQGNLGVNQARLGLERQREAREASKSNEPAWTNDLDRGLQIDPRTGNTRPIVAGGAPVGAKGASKQAEQSKAAIQIITEAEKLIDKSTGSTFGAGVDAVGNFFGGATPGAVASGQLQALEGALMLNQPRMEGPQSDKDTALYKQMAGKIGDPTVPNATKKASLATVKALHQKYAAGASSARTVVRTGTESGTGRRVVEYSDGTTGYAQ